MTKDDELVRRIRERQWFHTIDLGDGLVTNGDSPHSRIIAESIPDVRGKSVLDIGAWDGKYSFEAEASGASRVVALDHYVWKLDPVARQDYYDKCEAEGVLPDPDMIDRGFLVDDGLPGRVGFDMAHQYLDSKVEVMVDDFTTMDVGGLDQFDVVFYFGVLYHMVDPIGSLKRLARVTKEVAVVETAAIEVPGYSDGNLVGFFAGDELHADYGNWFAPSASALQGMCRAAGFRNVELKAQTTEPPRRNPRIRGQHNQPVHCRIAVLAYK